LRVAGKLRDADLGAVDRETSDGLHVVGLRVIPWREDEPTKQGDEQMAHGWILIKAQ
jgi:hypothetical protein